MAQEDKSPEETKHLDEEIKKIVESALVKDFDYYQDVEFGPDDFVGIAESAEESFNSLKKYLPQIQFETLSLDTQKHVLLILLKACGTHSKVYLWSSETAVSLCTELQKKILEWTKCKTLGDLLCGTKYSQTIFKQSLLHLRPFLAKDTWERNPSTRHIFRWLLFNVKHPNLADYLVDILPPSLIFTDHYMMQNKVLGIECLSHIIDNVPPTELKLYGRADVVYNALFHLTYCKEVDVISVLYPCILKFLIGQEGNLHRKAQVRTWGHFDEIYHQLLWNLEVEDKISLRRAYSVHISQFVQHMGITVVKHLKRTMRFIQNFLSICDGIEETCRINALNTLEIVIKVAWPRMENHLETIMKSIIFFLYDIETDRATSDEKVKQEIVDLCSSCLLLLKVSCPENFKVAVDKLSALDKDFPGLHIVYDVYSSNT